MKRFVFLSALLTADVYAIFAQFAASAPELCKEELLQCSAQRSITSMRDSFRPSSDRNIDATYYKISLNITTSPNYLRGVVTARMTSRIASLTSITLDLMNAMTVDSIIVGGIRTQFVQHPTTVSIELDRSYGYGEVVVLDVFYRGIPVSTGFGSFEFGNHANTPWVWTLSEPYGARDWWPCKDHPNDKADSVDIWVTCRRDFKVASNGKLVAIVENADSTHTYKWAERYPITSYLVFISLTNYAEFTNWFRYSQTDSMPILNYVLPEHLADARDSLPKVIDMLRIFSERFGLYPFINEKFGHAEFGRGGAMEHQTMTSLIRPAYAEFVLAHELAHQWFGDLITCASWQHLWLNEGFASYCESIYDEEKYGVERYRSSMQATMNTAKTGVGPVFKADTFVVRQLFDQGTVYRKGASVLHMLRHVLGDSVFFRCIKSYVADPRFRFGVATTFDFQIVCETVATRPLGWFFDQWIYGEKYPRYSFTWSAIPDTDGGYFVNISLSQTTGTTNPSFFTMPIDFRFSSAGWDTTLVHINAGNNEQFRVWVSRQPTLVELDPDNWILKDVTSPSSVHAASAVAREFRLEQNYPNPFNPSTIIKYQMPNTSHATLKVFDILGREVATLVNEAKEAGVYEVEFNAHHLSSGVYLYRLTTTHFTQTRKFLLLR